MPLPLKKAVAIASCLALSALLAVPITAAQAQPPSQSQTEKQKDLVRADAALSAVQKRVALVIGNKDYESAPLKNPVNDAESMAATLRGLGFEVICKTNLTNRQMTEAVDEFAGKLNKNTIGLFYFSGHGVQVNGINYLVPIGYKINRQADVPFEAFPAQRLLDTMGGSGCTLNLVILDACRNNPLPKSLRSAGDNGLGKMDAPSGTLVAYATAPGQTASDDSEKNNGLYTGVLLDKMKTPGLKIEEVFKLTRVSVKVASKGAQTPWEESSLENDFYFAAGLPAPAPAPVPAPVVVPGNGSVVDTKGRLKVTANVANAVVTVDGQTAPGGQFLLNLPDAEQKEVKVKVTAPGYEGQTVDVTLLRGKTVTEAVVLEFTAVPKSDPEPTGGVPLTLDFTDAPIERAITQIAEIAHLQLIIEPSDAVHTYGWANVKIYDQPSNVALHAAATSAGAIIFFKDGIYHLRPNIPADPNYKPLIPVPVPPPVSPKGAFGGAVTINSIDGAELVYIPAGPFLMGDNDQVNNKRRTVTLPAYAIYKNLVTVAMYEKFCKATNRQMPDAPSFNANWSKKNHPIVNVRWDDAKAYCDWAGAVLPSEAQWEKAARGGDGRRFPWGNTFDANKSCNSVKKEASGTAPVGSFPSDVSPYGVLDMAGNAWQWCSDEYDKTDMSVRGGSWAFDAASSCRSSIRDGYGDRSSLIGFRCVRPSN